MLIDSNNLPRKWRSRADDFYTLYAAVHRFGPLMHGAWRVIVPRVWHCTVRQMLCQGAVNNGPDSYWSSRQSADVSRYKPLVVEFALYPFLKTANVVSRGN